MTQMMESHMGEMLLPAQTEVDFDPRAALYATQREVARATVLNSYTCLGEPHEEIKLGNGSLITEEILRHGFAGMAVDAMVAIGAHLGDYRLLRDNPNTRRKADNHIRGTLQEELRGLFYTPEGLSIRRKPLDESEGKVWRLPAGERMFNAFTLLLNETGVFMPRAAIEVYIADSEGEK